MPDLEYVSRVDTEAGLRGTVLDAEAWSKLSVTTQTEFTAREMAEPAPEPEPVEEK